MEELPASADTIHQPIQRDPILSRMMEHTKQGFSGVYEKELDPFYRRKDELPRQDGWLCGVKSHNRLLWLLVGFDGANPTKTPNTSVG